MADARPFLRWVGGKRGLVDDIVALLPPEPGRIYEPFAGGAALFLARLPTRAVLGDANADLVNAYRWVRDDVNAVIELLREHAAFHSTERYHVVRARAATPDPEGAARLIYLNKTNFNGLYRVNKKGQFNVPIGKFTKPPTICDEENLRACSVALQGVELRVGDFEVTVADAQAGDVVYFDPPYVPVSATSSFTSYAVDGFADADQRRLAKLIAELAARGVTCIASNSDAPLVRELYADCELVEVSRAGTVSSKATKRERVGELLIRRAAARVEPRGPSLAKAYASFIERKSQIDNNSGFVPVWLPSFLFDFQIALVEWAVRKGRAALFVDTGMGKTAMQLVWAENVVRHAGGAVLILAPLAVSAQTIREGAKFGITVKRALDGINGPGIYIANYERLHQLKSEDFVGIVCDESSILKSSTGETKKRVVRFALKLPYRLLCTATPSPNDHVELGTSSEALGELGYSDMLSRFFKQTDAKGSRIEDVKRSQKDRAIEVMGDVFRRNNGGDTFAKLSYRVVQDIDGWRLKGHAVVPFWRWVSSWARACRKPSDVGSGFDDGRFVLPGLEERHHVVKAARPPEGQLFNMPAFGLSEEREERRRTLKERCELAASLCHSDDLHVIWCQLNAEGDLLEKLIPGSVQVSGKDSDEFKEAAVEWFNGERCLCSPGAACTCGHVSGRRVLISKASIFGAGLNLQCCAHSVEFATHSYEDHYQLIRRFHRFGQTRKVVADIISTEGEVRVRDSMTRKSAQATAMFEALVEHMKDATAVARLNDHTKRIEVPSWL